MVRRAASMFAMCAVAFGASIARAQPIDPYGNAKPPAAKPKKPPKAPKTPAPVGPQDPYGDAAPAPTGPQDPYAQPTPTGPQDPYAQPAAPTPVPPVPVPVPAPAPAPSPSIDQPSDIDEAVAAALVTRAHHLLDVQAWADAKQLAVESLVRSPGGASAADAKEIVRVANQHLGIVDEAPPVTTPTTTKAADTAATSEPASTAGVMARAEEPVRGRTVLTGYGIAGGALLGLGVVGAGDGVSGGGADTAGAIIGGLAGGGLAWWLGDKNDVTFTEARTVGSGMTWGALEFAFLTDAVGGTNVHTTHDEITVGASIGLALGTLGGVAYAKDHSLTAGDVTMIDSFAGMGVVGGLTIGELMQPFASEAYSLNAAIGAAGGVVVGIWAAQDNEISSSRMVRVDAVAAAGAAAPWLIYAVAHSSSTSADERVFGLLSTAGLLTGAYLGFRWTRDYDEKHLAAKPKALELGALDVRPATTPLARDEKAGGFVVDLLRGSF